MDATEKVTIMAVCGDCGGTGIYSGFAEPKGVGVVCLSCSGSGCREITYEPFKERKPCTDIETVRMSRGGFIATGVGPTGSEISYADFLSGKMPVPQES